ncbi:MAG: CBS domain-containing protein [Fuerstiella sp.]
MSVVDLFHQIAKNDFGFFQQVKSVADVMTKEPLCLSLDDTFEVTEEQFRRKKVDHAAVLNPDDQSIVGVVSDRDLLRHRPRLLGKAAERDEDQKALRDSVTRFMTRSPLWCTGSSSPIHAMSLMLDHHVDSVLVSPDGRTLDGIVTPNNFIQTLLLYHHVCTRDFDLRRLRLVDLDFRNGIPLDEIFSRGAQTVRDVMTKDVECLSFDEVVSAAIAKMQELEVRHLPVVSADGKIVGILSDRDILRCLPVHQNRAEEPETRFRQVLFATDDRATLHTRVDTIMSRELNSVHPDMLLTDAMAVLQKAAVSGLPVLEPQTKQLCGILTTSDILRVFRVVMHLGMLADSGARTAPTQEVAD